MQKNKPELTRKLLSIWHGLLKHPELQDYLKKIIINGSNTAVQDKYIVIVDQLQIANWLSKPCKIDTYRQKHVLIKK